MSAKEVVGIGIGRHPSRNLRAREAQVHVCNGFVCNPDPDHSIFSGSQATMYLPAPFESQMPLATTHRLRASEYGFAS
jgi:hypothetical protein